MTEEETALEVLEGDWIEQAIKDIGEDELTRHLEDMNKQLDEFTEKTSAHNIVYGQEGPMKKAVELLLKEYAESDEYGEHEAEMLATAIILQREIEEGKI